MIMTSAYLTLWTICTVKEFLLFLEQKLSTMSQFNIWNMHGVQGKCASEDGHE